MERSPGPFVKSEMLTLHVAEPALPTFRLAVPSSLVLCYSQFTQKEDRIYTPFEKIVSSGKQ